MYIQCYVTGLRPFSSSCGPDRFRPAETEAKPLDRQRADVAVVVGNGGGWWWVVVVLGSDGDISVTGERERERERYSK